MRKARLRANVATPRERSQDAAMRKPETTKKPATASSPPSNWLSVRSASGSGVPPSVSGYECEIRTVLASAKRSTSKLLRRPSTRSASVGTAEG